MKEIKHQDIVESILNKDVGKRKQWEHLFILKHKFGGDVRRYLLSMGDFKEEEENNMLISNLVMCQNSEFHKIDCLESEKQFGFFNSVNDVRPGHATWINKEDAEKLYILFTNPGVGEK